MLSSSIGSGIPLENFTQFKASGGLNLTLFQDLEDEREVQKDEIEEYCNSYSIPYIETSAKVGTTD